jgi:hypothetical protein
MPTFVDPPILGGSCMDISAISNIGFVRRPISSTAFVAISQAACRAITLSTFADSRFGRYNAQDDVFEAS